jgi:hypothetical protein
MLILVLVIIICFTVTLFLNTKEAFLDAKSDLADIDIVVSRYNENIQWLDDIPLGRVILYEKGPRSLDKNSIYLPNVGRCDHTYLYHIIKNYDNLADVTVFLPGSVLLKHKWLRYNQIMDAVTNYKKTQDIDYIYKVQKELCGDYSQEEFLSLNLGFTLDNFVISKHASASLENKSLNDESTLQLSPIRPFGEWFRINLPGIELKPCVWYYGIFVATKKQIQKHPIEVYKRLIKYVDNHSNPEVGHYLERSWANIFM